MERREGASRARRGRRGRGPAAWARRGSALALALGTAACATTGATLGSGVGDRLLDDPPYYAGRIPDPVGEVAHLPIAYQRGGSQAAMFDPEAASGPVAALLDEMNAYLDSLGVSVALSPAGPLSGVAPDVRFGCEQNVQGECVREEEGAAASGPPWMMLSVGRPSGSWVASARRALEGAGAERVLVLTLEVGQYWPDQRNLRGQKEVRLGTGFAVDVPWLTALDRPVQVLQLTGALVDPDGRALRIGAEGLVARRTNLLLGALGVQELLREEDVEEVRAARRDDLPGRPLVWQVALRNLVAQLTGSPEPGIR